MTAPSLIQVGNNRVTIDGSSAFVDHMQKVVIEALQHAPLGEEIPGRRGPRRRRAAAAPARRARRRTGRRGARRGRVPGRTVNGKYIRPGDPIPPGYREFRGRIVPIAAGVAPASPRRRRRARRTMAKPAAPVGSGRAGRRGLIKGSKLIDGKMYSPHEIARSPDLQRKLRERGLAKARAKS
jgi:hypothetical protein